MKNKFVDGILASLRDDAANWTLTDYSVDHISGIKIWIANVPVLSISLWRPFEFGFSFMEKLKIYRATEELKRCRALSLLDAKRGGAE